MSLLRRAKKGSFGLYAALAVLAVSSGTIALVFAGDQAPQPSSSDSPSAAASPAPAANAPVRPAVAALAVSGNGCLADAATLDDLRRQRTELEGKQRELDAREAELKTREQAVAEQIKTLGVTRDEIEKVEEARKAETETKIAKLVETLESMTPKSCSALLSSLDEGLATAAMARLSTAKLAKVMNVMEPARSARLSEILAGVARAKTHLASRDATAATTERTPASSMMEPDSDGPSKGGDSK